MSAATSATRLDLIALAVAGMLPLAWSGGQVERAREAVEEVSAPVQHCDHAGRDGAIRGELDGDDPEDSQTRRKGKVNRSRPAFNAQGEAAPRGCCSGCGEAPRRTLQSGAAQRAGRGRSVDQSGQR
jgi:hypothetical protein